jgi:hypothetical protein
MTVKTITRSDGRTFRFGRKRPVVRRPVLSLKNYILPGLPTPPASTSYAALAASALAQMYENDSLGDCVIAGVQHVEGLMTGNQPATPLLYTTAQTTAFYSAACGYVPGNPSTDQGCDIQTVLAYWENNGAPAGSAHKPVGYLAVDPTNQVEVQTAIWLFQNAVPGIDLPDAWINPFPSAPGFLWDVAGAPDPDNGHCPPGIDYNAQGMVISTWAMTGVMTWAAVAYYCAAAQGGEMYTVISQDTLNAATGLAPDGLDWVQMVADFNAMGGTVTPPTPTPPTPPTPVPPTPTPPPTPVPPTPTNLIVVQGEMISQQPVPGNRHEKIYTIQGTLVAHNQMPTGPTAPAPAPAPAPVLPTPTRPAPRPRPPGRH